nr:cyclase family protein [Candidatus Woesebacteria bacterium]
GYPSMTAEFAQILVDRKVKVVGMDILGPDTDPSWPAHKVLLGNEVLIIENLTNLEKLLEVQEFKIIALPSKYQTDASPVRVIAEVL